MPKRLGKKFGLSSVGSSGLCRVLYCVKCRRRLLAMIPSLDVSTSYLFGSKLMVITILNVKEIMQKDSPSARPCLDACHGTLKPRLDTLTADLCNRPLLVRT